LREIISSEENQKVKFLKKLYKRKTRRQRGIFLLEGYRIIEEALKSEALIDSLYMSPEFYQSQAGQELVSEYEKRADGRKIVLIKESILNRLADTQTPQGVIGLVQEREYQLADLANKDFLLLLDRIQDPGNMGTIIRTALAAGVDGIIILKGSVDIYNLKVLRSTMGAIFKIPLIQDLDLEDFLSFFQASEYKLISADLSAEDYYYQLDYSEPLIIANDNEANGLQEDLLINSDYRIKIPLFGDIESLNAAIAAGIILYRVAEKKFHK